MYNLFKEKAQSIRIYLSTEIILDPFEKNIEEVEITPIPIKAIVTDLTATKIQYAMPGVVSDSAKELIIRKKDRPILEMSRKIQIQGDSNLYEGWKTNGKMQIRNEQEFCRIYIFIKKVS